VRSYEFARRWVAAGHEVTIVTSSGYDESLTVGTSINVDGITVKVIGGTYKPTMGFVRRLWSYFTYAVQSSWFAFRARRYDVVLATSTPLTIAVPALIAKVFANRSMVFEVRDVWPDAAVDAGMLKNGLLYHLAKWLEMAAYRKSDHIVALSDGMLDRIVSKGVSRNKISMFPNCSDVGRFAPALFDRKALRKEYGVNDKFVLLYVGAINIANDMPFLAKCISILKENPSIQWWFVGGGNQLQYVEDEVRKNSIKNVRFWGKQPKSEVPKFVNAADIGVVSFINQPVYYENSPNKFFDYIAGGLPSIFTRTTWLKPYLEQAEAALICEDNSVDEFVSFVNMLKSNQDLRDEYGRKVLGLANSEFSRKSVSERYINLLSEVAGK